jgi:hypothetical protein
MGDDLIDWMFAVVVAALLVGVGIGIAISVVLDA